MPIRTELDPARQCLRGTASGVVTVGDLMDVLSTRDELGAWTYPMLMDWRGADGIAIADHELALLVGHARSVGKGRRPGAVAVVSTLPAVNEVLTAYLTTSGMWSDMRVAVFDDIRLADEWLPR